MVSIVKVHYGTQFVVNFRGKYICGPYYMNDMETVLNAVRSAVGILAKRN